MKIRIEMTKTEVQKLRKTSASVAYSIGKTIDEDMAKDYDKKFKDSFDKALNSKQSSKLGSVSAYDSGVGKPPSGGKIIEIDLKAGFVNSTLSLVDVFYVSVADFIIKISAPFEKFADKYM